MFFIWTILACTSFCRICCSLPISGSAVIRSSALFSAITSNITFTENLAPALASSGMITEISGMAESIDGSIYIVGSIETVDEGLDDQSLATSEMGDRLGEQDMLLLKVSKSGRKQWGKRFGSRGHDAARALTTDSSNNVYIAGSVGRSMGEMAAGAVVLKYGGDGNRQWVQTFGSKAAQDSLNGITLNVNASEVIAAGTIGADSPLHSEETRQDGFAVLILRLSAGNGEILAMAVGEKFDSTDGSLGNAIAVNLSEGGGRCFVAGYSLVQSSGSYMNNAAVYSFDYPNLAIVAKREIRAQTIDSFTNIARSMNGDSLFAVGARDVSIYEEDDALVFALDANSLTVIWSRALGSFKFTDQASIVTGAASERAQDVNVDKYGNTYVLLEASGAVVSGDSQMKLSNRRAALVVFQPNGTVLHKVQSARTEVTSPTCMIANEGKVLIGGWTVDEVTSTSQLYLSGVALPGGVYASHGPEYVSNATQGGNGSDKAGSGDGGDGGSGGDRDNEGDDDGDDGDEGGNIDGDGHGDRNASAFMPVESGNSGTVIGAAVGGVAGVLIIALVSATLMRRTRRG